VSRQNGRRLGNNPECPTPVGNYTLRPARYLTSWQYRYCGAVGCGAAKGHDPGSCTICTKGSKRWRAHGIKTVLQSVKVRLTTRNWILSYIALAPCWLVFRRFAIPWGGVLLGSMTTRQIRGGKGRGRSAKAGRAVCAHGDPWIRYSMRVRGSGSVYQILSCPTHGILPCAQLVAGWAPLADRTLSSPPPSEKLSAVYGQKDCQLGCCYSVPSALQQQGKGR
jgi:hypothetical protein